MSAPVVDESAQDDLESSLGDIKDIADVLLRMGGRPGREVETYLGSKLEEAANVALDRYARLFKLNQYKELATEK
jgi:hypothetical protein